MFINNKHFKILKKFLIVTSLIMRLYFDFTQLKIERDKNNTQIIININYNNLNFIKIVDVLNIY